MSHPIFKDPPSTDMTAAQERQRELDAQVAAFLAKGGEIKAFDHLSRPTACTPWRSQSINPRQPEAAPEAVPETEPEPAQVKEKVLAVISKPKRKVAKSSAEAEMRAIRLQVAALERRLNSMRARS